ncbi:hypothetical protein EST38_g14484 [Candolleomyces aberdarensis]|uniref:Uncharacterized protein n=1 Tax=Candolleomyces aberdarensis TaxID=2316362 RepID=A0A4Q2CYB7_9AGAR|nr:hypothetical protein EST38_g14484 [Candolleomyces aberdarensis]
MKTKAQDSVNRHKVVFGSQNAGIYPPGTPVVVKQSDTATIPILIVCVSQNQAEDIQYLNSLTGDVVRTTKSGIARIKAFLECLEDVDPSELSFKSQKWYAVWELQKGDQEIHRSIFAHYGDYAHLTTDGPGAMRHHRKFYSLVSAIVWLLARGSSDLLFRNNLGGHAAPSDRRIVYDTPDTEIRNLNPNIIQLSDEEDFEGELPQPRGPSRERSVINLVTPPSALLPPSPAASKAKSKRTPVTPTPSAPSRGFKSKGSSKRALSISDSEDVRPVAPATPMVSQRYQQSSAWLTAARVNQKAGVTLPSYPLSAPSISTASNSTLASISSVSSLSFSSSSSSRTVQATPRSSLGSDVPDFPALSSQVFMRQRAIDGTVTGTVMCGSPEMQDLVLPTSAHLRVSVVDYLRSHGYNSDMIVLVETALAASGSDDGFTKAMALRGLPCAESGFIWRLAHKCHAL